MPNAALKIDWLSFLLDAYSGEEIALNLLRIRAMLHQNQVREYLDEKQELDTLLFDLACYFAEVE